MHDFLGRSTRVVSTFLLGKEDVRERSWKTTVSNCDMVDRPLFINFPLEVKTSRPVFST